MPPQRGAGTRWGLHNISDMKTARPPGVASFCTLCLPPDPRGLHILGVSSVKRQLIDKMLLLCYFYWRSYTSRCKNCIFVHVEKAAIILSLIPSFLSCMFFYSFWPRPPGDCAKCPRPLWRGFTLVFVFQIAPHPQGLHTFARYNEQRSPHLVPGVPPMRGHSVKGALSLLLGKSF